MIYLSHVSSLSKLIAVFFGASYGTRTYAAPARPTIAVATAMPDDLTAMPPDWQDSLLLRDNFQSLGRKYYLCQNY